MTKHIFFEVLDEITGSKTNQNCYISVPERIYLELKNTPTDSLLTRSILSLNLIELLSQYQSGKLHKKGTHKRFDRFLQAYTSLGGSDRNLLYAFRNAAVHNGGGYASNKSGQIFRFKLSLSDTLIHAETRIFYQVGVPAIEHILELILTQLAQKLTTDRSLTERFIQVHKQIGCAY